MKYNKIKENKRLIFQIEVRTLAFIPFHEICRPTLTWDIFSAVASSLWSLVSVWKCIRDYQMMHYDVESGLLLINLITYVTIIIVNFFVTIELSDESQTGVTELEMFDVYVYGPNSLFLRMMWLDYLDPNAILTTRSYTYPTSKKYL